MIELEHTASDERCNFLLHRMVHTGAAIHFPDRSSAAGSPLAEKLFEIGGVASVAVGQDYVSVYKDKGHSWDTVAPEITAFLEGVFPPDLSENDEEFWRGWIAAELLVGAGLFLGL